MNNLVSQKANFGFSIYLVCLPLASSLMGLLFDCYIAIPPHLFIWSVVYVLFILTSIFISLIKGKSLKFSFKFNLYSILLLCMIAVMLISSCVNSAFNINLASYFSLIIVFLNIFQINEKQSLLVDILIVSMGLCCIMGFIDPYGAFMPGFSNFSYPMSLQFNNPNYSGVIMCIMAIITYLKTHNNKSKLKMSFYITTYLIFITHLFMNGSFVPISAVVLAEIFSLIYFSIKDKKVPLTLILLSISSIAICFLVDLIPNIADIRSCDYNYFYECVAVFDNLFNTKLLKLFGIDSIMGSDGWDRNELMARSFKNCTASVKNFLFGSGAGTYEIFRPHNPFLSLWLDFGIFMPLLYSTFYIGWFVKILKMKYSESQTKQTIAIATFLIGNICGSLLVYSYWVLVIILAIHLKEQFRVVPSVSATKKE